jgi:uncharacterized protein DUF4382
MVCSGSFGSLLKVRTLYMRFRSLSLLATSAVAALLGCSSEPSTAQAPPTSPDADSINSSARHDDPVDSPSDLSWVPSQPESGSSALRVLMTDAPIAADSVFVTFCGIYVEAASSTETDEPSQHGDAGVEPLDKSKLPRRSAEDSEQADAGHRGSFHSEHDVALGADAGSDPAEHAKAVAARAGWHTISDKCQTLDLLTLQGGITEAVGIGSLPPGSYGQIRLMLVNASIVVAGLTFELVVPSGSESGLKIAGGFTLHDGEASTITLDFDAGQSIHYSAGGGYMMAPVIHISDMVLHPTAQADAGSSKAD